MCDTTIPQKGGDLLLSNVTLYGEENTGVHERTHCKMNQLVYRVTKLTRPPDVCASCCFSVLYLSYPCILGHFCGLFLFVQIVPFRMLASLSQISIGCYPIRQVHVPLFIL